MGIRLKKNRVETLFSFFLIPCLFNQTLNRPHCQAGLKEKGLRINIFLFSFPSSLCPAFLPCYQRQAVEVISFSARNFLSFESALTSICLTLSRVTPNLAPMLSRVSGSHPRP